MEALRARTNRLTRDQARSLWLGYAIAGKIVVDPQGVLAMARAGLAQLQVIHSRGAGRRWLAEWEKVLEGPVDDILDALTARVRERPP